MILLHLHLSALPTPSLFTFNSSLFTKRCALGSIGGIIMSNKQKIFRLALVSLFIALMMVMNFTPLGYITTGLFSITLMTIPVALGAVCTGVWGGAVLGVVFGLTSFLQAFGIGFMIDPSAAVLFNTDPIAYTLTCFIPRITVGLVSALIFRAFEKANRVNLWAFILSAASVPLLNTLLFMGFYAVLYKNTVLGGAPVMAVILSALGINFVVEFAVTLVAGVVVNKTIYYFLKKMR